MKPTSLKKLLRNAVERIIPGIGQRRRAHETRRRAERFASARWQRSDAFARRHYPDYETYLTHQAEKLDRMYARRDRKDQGELAEFLRRFSGCELLREARNVLCLGARLGAEVRALRELGFFAVGLDLNPGRDNCYVCHGDFHDLKFREDSVDAVYTNALDHVFDLAKVMAEVRRVLRPGGLFVADVPPGFTEGFTPGEYEATYWRSAGELIDRLEELAGFEQLGCRDLGSSRRLHWMQIVFRKPPDADVPQTAAAG